VFEPILHQGKMFNKVKAAVLYQLHSKEPLFKRCISMSGTPIMLKTLPLSGAEMAYTSIIKEFDLENASTEERIQRLKTAEPEELVEKTPMSVPLLPFLDGGVMPKPGDIVPEKDAFAKLGTSAVTVPGMRWCEELMIGDCRHDGNVFLFMGLAQRKAGVASALTTSLHANLPASAANAILQAYNIGPGSDDDTAMKIIIDLATDIVYVTPALAYARSFPGKAYYYQFNEPNPWEGPFKGCSTHMLDAAFLFQNFNEHMSAETQKVAKHLALDFVKFANGVKPWEEFQKETGRVRTYGSSDQVVRDIVENNGWGNGRRDVLWKLSEEGKVDLDQLSVAWDMFIAGQ
jgi:carboxylesterase type B